MNARIEDGDGSSVESQIHAVVDLSRRIMANVAGSASEITQINRATHILSMNARVEAARAGIVGAGFATVAEELTRLSASISTAAGAMISHSRVLGAELDQMIEHLSTRVRDERLCDLALTNIDLIDRNLYERSCDVRWWATDAAVCGCLTDRQGATRQYATQRLAQILDSYTVYLDLVVADLDGIIVANGRPDRYRLIGSSVADSEWFSAGAATHSGEEFGFQSVHVPPLVRDRVLMYSCAIREGGKVNGKPLGVLGIALAWDKLGQTVVTKTPLSVAEWKVTRACVVDDLGRVLADSAQNEPTTIDFSERSDLFSAPRGSITTQIDGRRVRVAHARSPGFETYRTGWHGLLIRQLE